MSAARGSGGWLLAAPRRRRGVRLRFRTTLAVFSSACLAAAAGAARADEPADRGISLSAFAGGAYDRSVAQADRGHHLNETAPVVGATGVGNIERFAIGGAVDTTPAALGNGRLTIGALLGYQPHLGRTRFHLLGEAGGHRFSEIGSAAMARQPGSETWLPYAGVRVGAARTVPAHGFVELGVWLFGRYDLGHTTVTNAGGVSAAEPASEYRLGGMMAGLALQAGLRLESPHPWNQGMAEP